MTAWAVLDRFGKVVTIGKTLLIYMQEEEATQHKGFSERVVEIEIKILPCRLNLPN